MIVRFMSFYKPGVTEAKPSLDGSNVDQSKACSQQKGRDVPKKEKHSKTGDMPSGSSQHMREE